MLHLTHVCPRFKTVHGGGEPVLLNLFRELADLGLENTVLTVSFPRSYKTSLDKRVELRTLPFQSKINNPVLESLYNFFSSPLLLRWIPARTDLVCFYVEDTVPAMFVYKSLFRKPCLYYCFQPPRFAYDTADSTISALRYKSFRWLLPLFSKFYRPFDQYAVRKADRILTFSAGYKEWIERVYGVSDVRVLPPGVHRPERLEPLPDSVRSRIRPDSKVLVFTGKFVGKKNLDRLLNVVDLVRGHVQEVLLLLVGDGPERAKLEKIVRERALQEHIVFCGYVEDNNAVFSYYEAAHLAILLEYNVSFGLSLTEANACGIPCIAFNAGGPADIIRHGENGFLFPSDATDEAIASRIVEYFRDTGQMQRMRQQSLANAKRYSWKEFGRTYARLLSDITRGAAKQT